MRGDPIRPDRTVLFRLSRFRRRRRPAAGGYKFGRAHHRVLHFVNRHPGLTIAELLDILRITKQSLNRVLKELLDQILSSRRGRRRGPPPAAAVSARRKGASWRWSWRGCNPSASPARLARSARARARRPSPSCSR
jgi:hypothetical protein